MFVLVILLLSPLPAQQASRSSQLPSCERVATSNLRTGETGQSYCLANPRLHRILGLMKKIPRPVSWIEKVDCS